MFYYVLLFYTMLYYVLLCSTMFYYVLLCSVLLVSCPFFPLSFLHGGFQGRCCNDGRWTCKTRSPPIREGNSGRNCHYKSWNGWELGPAWEKGNPLACPARLCVGCEFTKWILTQVEWYLQSGPRHPPRRRHGHLHTAACTSIIFDMSCAGPNGIGKVPKRGGQDKKEDWQVTQVVTKQHNGACLQRPRIEPTMSPFQKRRGSQPAISPEMPSRSPMVCRVLPKCRTPREKRATSMATRGLGNCSWQAVKPVVLGISILFTQLSMDWFKENSTGNPGPTLSTKNQLCASNVQWGAPAIAGSPFAEADQKWEIYGMW